MQIEGKKIVVVGLGITGRATARFLKNRGASVRVVDSAAPETLAAAAAEMRALDVAVEIGPHRPEAFAEADLIVISPGVPHTLAPIAEAAGRGVEVMGEIELASRFVTVPIIAVSGTNGKTTATTLIGRILQGAGMDVFVGGNIGNPLIGFVETGQTAQLAVVEISSFQLDTTDRFHPDVAVMLNVAEDHLDRYPDMDGYVASKARLFRNQTAADTAVVNGADPRTRAMAESIAARRLVFGWTEAVTAGSGQGAVLREKEIWIRMTEVGETTVPFGGFTLPGPHNRENAAAAVLAALAAGAGVEAARGALDGFTGLPHRLEKVAVIDGVTFYDDSKATNVDAVRRALETFSSPVVLLLGGRDKNTDFTPLTQLAAQKVRHAVVMGEAAPRLKQVLAPVVPVTEAGSMAEAVKTAFSASRPGTAVLLSPACASFDWYENYARRGEDFRRHAEALQRREKNR
ncbi:MAG: UDP-N-acetylmuramoyl-L-alanine--D-glutamate ligase [Desulfobacterales bacterium]|jgi:UDP-N-acetylmuramoylalanine--D-glutamate ligase